MWPWRVKMPTQNLLRLLLLLMLEMRIVLATVSCRFRSCDFGQTVKLLFRLWAHGLVKILKLKFRQDLRLASLFSADFVEVMKLNLGQDSEARFGQYFEVYVLWRGWFLVEILMIMVEILKMKLDHDLSLNLWKELNPRVRCAFGNVFCIGTTMH